MTVVRRLQGLHPVSMALFFCAILVGLTLLRPTRSGDMSLAPELRWQQDGKSSSLNMLKGKVVLAHFWARWCAPCLEEMPLLAELERERRAQPFEILALHVDSITEREREALPLGSYPKNLIWTFDMHALDRLDVDAIPITYIIDKQGNLRQTLRGPQNWRSKQLGSEIDKLMTEPNPAVASLN